MSHCHSVFLVSATSNLRSKNWARAGPSASRKARYLLDGTQSIHPQKHDNWFMDKTKAPALQKRLLWHQYVVARFKSLECTLLPESHVKVASNN